MELSITDVVKWGGMDFSSHLNEKTNQNIKELLKRVNALLWEYMKTNGSYKPVITSGLRPVPYEISKGRSGRSSHTEGRAIDLWDPDCALGEWCCANEWEMLKKFDLYCEARSVTHKSDNPKKRWFHLTTRPPHSKRREFLP